MWYTKIFVISTVYLTGICARLGSLSFYIKIFYLTFLPFRVIYRIIKTRRSIFYGK